MFTVAIIAFAEQNSQPFTHSAGGWTFAALGVLPHPIEGKFMTPLVHDVSDDGTVVLGEIADIVGGVYGQGVFRWTAKNGLELLNLSPDPFAQPVHPSAISGDGTMIVGVFSNPANNQPSVFYWTEGDGITPIGAPTGLSVWIPADVTNDGSAISLQAYGITSGIDSYRWTAKSGFEAYLSLPNYPHSYPFAIAGNGSRMVGTSGEVLNGIADYQAVYWNVGDPNAQVLGELPGMTSTEAYAISDDGTVAVGRCFKSSPWAEVAVRWVIGEAPQQLSTSGYAIGSNVDGSFIVGNTDGFFGPEPFLWSSDCGESILRHHLIAAGVDLGGVLLSKAQAVSADGRVIIGWGLREHEPNVYHEESWIVTIPRYAPGDANGDGAVNVEDLLIAIEDWGRCFLPLPPVCAGDVTGDCNVDVADLLHIINNWGNPQ